MNITLNFSAICQSVCSCEIAFWENEVLHKKSQMDLFLNSIQKLLVLE